jgi:hypothetical protein
MRRSKIAEEDREALARLSRRLTPEERLMAYMRHAELLHRLYQAGLRHRMSVRRASKKNRLSG